MVTLKHIENQKDYDELLTRVDSFLSSCGGAVSMITSESFFSAADCHCCHRSLGGDRYTCEYYDRKENSLENCEVCNDCLTIIDTGRLDDMTMLDKDLE